MRRAVLFVAFCALAAGCDVSSVTAPEAPKFPHESGDGDEAKAGQSEVVARSLPALVLLLNTHADGSVGYGSGLIVDHAGTVLTSLHVVENGKLGAMLYRKDRVSYTPMDAGLSPLRVFENPEGEVISAPRSSRARRDRRPRARPARGPDAGRAAPRVSRMHLVSPGTIASSPSGTRKRRSGPSPRAS